MISSSRLNYKLGISSSFSNLFWDTIVLIDDNDVHRILHEIQLRLYRHVSEMWAAAAIALSYFDLMSLLHADLRSANYNHAEDLCCRKVYRSTSFARIFLDFLFALTFAVTYARNDNISCAYRHDVAATIQTHTPALDITFITFARWCMWEKLQKISKNQFVQNCEVVWVICRGDIRDAL